MFLSRSGETSNKVAAVCCTGLPRATTRRFNSGASRVSWLPHGADSGHNAVSRRWIFCSAGFFTLTSLASTAVTFSAKNPRLSVHEYSCFSGTGYGECSPYISLLLRLAETVLLILPTHRVSFSTVASWKLVGLWSTCVLHGMGSPLPGLIDLGGVPVIICRSWR